MNRTLTLISNQVISSLLFLCLIKTFTLKTVLKALPPELVIISSYRGCSHQGTTTITTDYKATVRTTRNQDNAKFRPLLVVNLLLEQTGIIIQSLIVIKMLTSQLQLAKA
jgi:hypothetical protein